MFIELHILQNFAPSCLNRDDTNSPKECEFGGFRRARISSQCLKRSIRTCFGKSALLPEENLARRTKLLVEEVAKRLEKPGRDRQQAQAVVETALSGAGLATDNGATQYLLFLGRDEIQVLATLCEKNWDTLAALAKPGTGDEAGKATRKGKKAAKQEFPADLKKQVLGFLDGGKAADLALFGRMLADIPGKNIDAACQVAHAISTNKVGVEFDFYTAVDDLQPQGETGAGMMGTIEFNSGCFYRYANIDLDQLNSNLGGDEELARKTVEAFIRAAVAAIPTGKQNSMAAQNPPSLVFAVVREHGLWSLANAFVKPVQPGRDGDLVSKSIEQLEKYWACLEAMYGTVGDGKWAVVLDGSQLKSLKNVGSIQVLIEKVMKSLKFNNTKEAGK